MTLILVPVILVLIGLTAVSLIRGIAAFMKSTRENLEWDEAAGPSPAQLQQNRMMYARIKYQAAAVVVIAFLLAFGRHG